MQTIGPTGETFNFADAHPPAGTAAEMFWLARRFDRPQYAAHERMIVRLSGGAGAWSDFISGREPKAAPKPTIWHLLWRSAPPLRELKTNPPPLDAKFDIGVVTMRSSWDDPNAWFVGFKGGDNKVNHAHADLGTFVLDAVGYRWGTDLGSDDYNLPGYFGKQRFDYYRLKTEGHNVFTIDGANQPRMATAPILAFTSKPTEAFAVADLKEGYAESLSSAKRGIRMLPGRQSVLVQDELDPLAGKSANVIWAMHTAAEVELHDGRATLTQHADGREPATIEATILAPPGARFELLPCNPPPPQGQQPNVRKLAVALKGITGPTRIAVLFAVPSANGQVAPIELQPLDRWTPIR
jgi:hypothetical protein